MNENIKLFLEKVMNDPELQEKLSAIRDPDEAYRLASEIQGGFTREEFIAEMTRIRDSMDEDLSDEDMAKSAGGMSLSAAISITAGSATASAAVTGATALSVVVAASI